MSLSGVEWNFVSGDVFSRGREGGAFEEIGLHSDNHNQGGISEGAAGMQQSRVDEGDSIGVYQDDLIGRMSRSGGPLLFLMGWIGLGVYFLG